MEGTINLQSLPQLTTPTITNRLHDWLVIWLPGSS